MRVGVAALSAVFLLHGPVAAQEHVHGKDATRVEPEHDGAPGSVTGYIRDVECLLRNPAAGLPDDAVALDCAQKCVRAGSPLVFYTVDEHIYLIISSAIPDTSQQVRLLPYVGKLVKASGRVFERDGIHTIAVQQVALVDPGKG